MLSLRSEGGPKWSTLLLEVVLIVLGVLLGLFANEWRKARADQARADIALEQVRAEIAYNQSEIDSALVSYHEQIRDSLRQLAQRATDGRPTTAEAITRAMPDGFRVPLLQTTAWDLSVQTGMINQFALETAAPIARLYTLQQFLQDKLDRISDNFYIASNVDPQMAEGQVRALSNLAGDIVIQERKLIRQYRETLSRLSTTDS
jgi:hypothetical protein